MSIYDKPTKTLMLAFAKDRLAPGRIFDKAQAVEWFAKHYPKIKPTTVQMHVEGMAVNSSVRKHHTGIRPGSEHDLFFKVAPGQFRLWEPDSDPAPLYRERLPATPAIEDSGVEDDEVVEDTGSQVFAFERDLRSYLSKNLGVLEQGLKLYQDEEFIGVEFPVGGRYIDLLATDRNGDFVVVELKVSRGHERTIGQLLRYMGWVQKNLAAGKSVKGIIVASAITDDLQLAASQIPDVRLFEYEIAFKLRPVANTR
jgi:endonuclease